MANLSNINNKFLFTDGDFLLINGATANSISATESGIAIKNSNAATLSLQNSAANGKNHTLWSNTDGSFNITDIGVATRFTIASGGNVGIGTSSPDGNLEVIASTTVSGASDSVNNVLIGLQAANRPTVILDTADTTYTNRTWNITNVGSAGSLFFGRNGLDVLVMKNDGNVGIATTTPDAKLTIGNPGGNTTRSIQIEGNNSASGMNGVIGYFANGLYISNNYYYNSGQVHPVSTYGQTNIACITGTTTGSNFIDLSVSDHTDSNNAPDVRMRIMDSGNVGIGAQSTGTLQNILQVSSGVDGDGIILTGIGDNTGIANGSYRKIGFRYDDTDESFESEIRFVVTNSGAHGGQMEFFTDNTSGVKTRAITIDNAQRVGIGTTSANAKLQIGSTQNVNATGISLCAGASVGNLIARTTTHHNWFPYSDGSNYYSADNHIFRNASHGTEWMRIASNGAIGIGGANYGTAGQVLTSNGNAAPSWQAAGGSAWPQEKFAEYTIDSTTSNILVATMNSTTWHGNYLAGCLKFTMSTSDYIQVTYVPVSTFLSGSNKWFFKGTEMTSKNNGSNPAVLVFTFAGDQGTFGSTCTLKINRNQNVSNYTKVNVLVQAISNPNMFILN